MNIRTGQEGPGHKDVRTTRIYTHVLGRGSNAVVSPLADILKRTPRMALSSRLYVPVRQSLVCRRHYT